MPYGQMTCLCSPFKQKETGFKLKITPHNKHNSFFFLQHSVGQTRLVIHIRWHARQPAQTGVHVKLFDQTVYGLNHLSRLSLLRAISEHNQGWLGSPRDGCQADDLSPIQDCCDTDWRL